MALRGKLWFISSGPDEIHRRTVLDDHGGKLVGSANELVGVFETAEAARRACRAINRHDEMIEALEAAEHWLSEETESPEPGATKPDEILRVIGAALAKARG